MASVMMVMALALRLNAGLGSQATMGLGSNLQTPLKNHLILNQVHLGRTQVLALAHHRLEVVTIQVDSIEGTTLDMIRLTTMRMSKASAVEGQEAETKVAPTRTNSTGPPVLHQDLVANIALPISPLRVALAAHLMRRIDAVHRLLGRSPTADRARRTAAATGANRLATPSRKEVTVQTSARPSRTGKSLRCNALRIHVDCMCTRRYSIPVCSPLSCCLAHRTPS